MPPRSPRLLAAGVLLSAVLLFESLAGAAVTGRFLRIEAPASSRMAIHEIELWSGSENIVRHNQDLSFAGTAAKGREITADEGTQALVDGVADLSQRAFTCGTAGGVNPWLELDLGRERGLDRVVFVQPREPQYDDRALRLITVLDEARRVVFAVVFDLRVAPFSMGTAAFELSPGSTPLLGRTVPPMATQWAPLGDVLELRPSRPPRDAEERLTRFASRHDPAELAQLAREFFARMDLTKPELRKVRERYARGDAGGALEAYRDHFLGKLQRVAFMPEHARPQSPYDAAADDLRRNIAVIFARFDVAAHRFTPGAINWGDAPPGDTAALEIARVRAMAGCFQLPLLTAFRATGRPEYLEHWCAITDDWGINIRNDLARAEQDLRDYFVKEPLQQFNLLAEELALTARQQPDFARQLPGATLARLLIPVLEEYPPAYWWPCRRATFNHTYNAMNAATITSRILDDFHAGQRLDRENRQHWQRVWTMMMTRDGSMNEIGDEGHLTMQWRMGAVFNQMRKVPPPWFTADFAAEFETGWRQTALYPLRHMTPDGRGHRLSFREMFQDIWQLTGRTCAIGGMIPRETVDSTAIMREPEVAAIMQQVFGAGRDRATLPPARQTAWDKVTAYYGNEYTPPVTASDWMPYAGLHYLRRNWEPDATFVAMMSQPRGHPGTNGSEWNTEFQVWDYGQPLLACGPLRVDGQPQFAHAGQLTFKPGSKTEALATASERPIPARWHTSPHFDYAESFYEGSYQRHGVASLFRGRPAGLELDPEKIEGVRADRRIILLRDARLVVVTDAVRVPGAARSRSYDFQQRFALPEPVRKGAATAGRLDGDADRLTLINQDAPGVTVRRFTSARLSWDPRNTPEQWLKGGAMANHSGALEELGGILRAETDGNLLMTALIEPHAFTGEASVRTTRAITATGVSGFTATLEDGATVTWIATDGEVRALTAAPVRIEGDGLLVWRKGTETAGLALGARSLQIGDRKSVPPAPDFEFRIVGERIAGVTVIHRPIEPVTFSPRETVFTEAVRVTLASATPGVAIHYTLDGREPDRSSALYTEPVTITADAFVRARAFRIDSAATPRSGSAAVLAAAGTEATVVSDARYYKRALLPAAAIPHDDLSAGVRWERVEGNWFALFSHLQLREVMPARATGFTRKLLDVGMREGDGAFGVRYEGYISVPHDGVWTFHAPPEYVGASCEPGYDLRVWIDGEEWDLGQRFHGRGRWSVPLAQGLHRLRITFADARDRKRTVTNSGLWHYYPTPWVVWKGEAPVLRVSGPGFPLQPVPDLWLWHEKTKAVSERPSTTLLDTVTPHTPTSSG